jgi:hypothetical protein
MDKGVFQPTGNSVKLSVTATTGSVALAANHTHGDTVRIANEGTNSIFIKFGGSGVTATQAAGMMVLAGTAEPFDLPPGFTHVAAICKATETAYMCATVGIGR